MPPTTIPTPSISHLSKYAHNALLPRIRLFFILTLILLSQNNASIVSSIGTISEESSSGQQECENQIEPNGQNPKTPQPSANHPYVLKNQAPHIDSNTLSTTTMTSTEPSTTTTVTTTATAAAAWGIISATTKASATEQRWRP